MADVAEIAAKVTVDGAEEAKRDLDGFTQSIEQTSTKSVSAAQKMQDVGKTMTTHVTAPLVAAGGLAVKTAVDFEGAFSKIQGLVGVSAGEVDQLREATLKLSGETAKAPGELADALFTVTSAGLRGGEAMQVLEMAAKASAAGMGDTRTIAEALTASINAYGPGVLDAARATDIMVATARAGNFETSQFAGALGQVLPIASSLNIGLEQVGGAVALLTRNNNDASASITQVRAIMQALLAPSAEATNILAQAGLTMADVRAVAAGPEGLVGALELMSQATGGNQEQLARMLGSVEAVGGAMVILNSDAAAIEGTFGAVANSAGTLDEAFQAASESSGFKMKQALADIQVTLIGVGDAILPVVTTVVDGIAQVVGIFEQLPGPVQNLTLIGAGALAAAGPVLTLAGNVAEFGGKLSKAADAAGGWGPMLGDISAKAYITAGAFAAVYVAIDGLTKNSREHAARVREVEAALVDQTGALAVNAESWRTWLEATQFVADTDLRAYLVDMGVSLQDLQTPLLGTTEQARAFHAELQQGGAISLDYAIEMVRQRDALAEVAKRQVETAMLSGDLNARQMELLDTWIASSDGLDGYLVAVERWDWLMAQSAVNTDEAASSWERLGLAAFGLEEAVDPAGIAVQGLLLHVDDMVAAAADAARETDNLGYVMGEFVQAAADAAYEALNLDAALRELNTATLDGFNAQIDLERQQQRTTDTFAKYREVLAETGGVGEDFNKVLLDGRESALRLADQMVATAESQQGLEAGTMAAKDALEIQISTLEFLAGTLSPGDPLRLYLEQYIAELKGTPDKVNTEITADTGYAMARLDDFEARANHVTRGRTSAVTSQVNAGSFSQSEDLLNWVARARTAVVNVATIGVGAANAAIASIGAGINAAIGAIGFADGGIRDGADMEAGIYRAQQVVVFAEPETGGEAYIPLGPDKRDRALDVWVETGRLLGVMDAGRSSDAGGVTNTATTNITEQHYHLNVTSRDTTTTQAEFDRMRTLAGAG